MKNNTSNLVESPAEEEVKLNDGDFETNREGGVEDPLSHNRTGEMQGLGLLSG
jgi:hypothetical protein